MKHRRLTDLDADAIGEDVRARLDHILRTEGPDALVGSFSSRIEIFAKHLALWGQKVNLTASPTDPDEILFHVIDSLAPVRIATKQTDSILAEALGNGCRILDIGSGAGFPGLILAAATGLETVLVESRRKRANFLEATAAAMGLFDVTVLQSRVTSANVSRGFDLVTMRAVRITPEFFQLAAAALKPGGMALAYLNADQSVDRDAAVASGLAALLSIHYEMSRGDTKISRSLALWFKDN